MSKPEKINEEQQNAITTKVIRLFDGLSILSAKAIMKCAEVAINERTAITANEATEPAEY